ncbi:MAG TPA: tripartite tricarboxylate transporter TctB family protein [Casimicrobiaceae bacterium]|nr:tripartite tricarboxylate transporter TctB family protein [Casimicrobiaceae bacterium]
MSAAGPSQGANSAPTGGSEAAKPRAWGHHTGIGPYLVVLAVSAGLFYASLGIASAGDSRLGADLWPKTILVLAIITCVFEIARRTLFAGRYGKSDAGNEAPLLPPGDAVEPQSPANRFVPWIGIALTTAYVVAFPLLGYFLATLIYVVAFVYFGNYRRPLRALAIGVVASVAFMLLFMRVVYVSLPIGVEPFAHVSTLLMGIMGIK